MTGPFRLRPAPIPHYLPACTVHSGQTTCPDPDISGRPVAAEVDGVGLPLLPHSQTSHLYVASRQKPPAPIFPFSTNNRHVRASNTSIDGRPYQSAEKGKGVWCGVCWPCTHPFRRQKRALHSGGTFFISYHQPVNTRRFAPVPCWRVGEVGRSSTQEGGGRNIHSH